MDKDRPGYSLRICDRLKFKNIDEASNPILTGSYTINDSNASFEVEEIDDTHITDVISKVKTSRDFGLIIFLVTF